MDSAHNPHRSPQAAGFLSGGGEMGRRMRAFDWSTTCLGPTDGWPQSLRTALGILLNSGYPMYIAWGREFIQFYNDAYRPILGESKHPALGQSTPETFAEIWDFIGPMFRRILAGGEATTLIDQLLPLDRNGYVEECYFTFSYSTILDEAGGAGGVFVTVLETTERVLADRRGETLRELARGSSGHQAEGVCQHAAQVLSANPYDIPFALFYVVDDDEKEARLACASGIEPGTQAAPHVVSFTEAEAVGWPLSEVARTGRAAQVELLQERIGPLPTGVWPEPPHTAMVWPVILPGHARPELLIVLAISARKALDAAYLNFFAQVAAQTGLSLAAAQAYEAERKRAEALAELDRAKTLFFSNVSHEFRTPLTLMLGPLEDVLARRLGPDERQELEVVHRNGLRLLRLVNTLLDFSRIEAGRVQGIYEPLDLAAYTTELASVFRSTVERAGLRLTVDCPPLAEAVYVDREMWEKIILNLLSNAFKFTFAGEIEVGLRDRGHHAELRVRDTGIGIAEDELPRLFERFHRIRGTQARTHEGTGIGLALVQELVKLHGGGIRVESEAGKGTTFIVTIPFGSSHLPADRVNAERQALPAARRAQAYVDEALRWLPEEVATGQLPVASEEAVVSGQWSVASEERSGDSLPTLLRSNQTPSPEQLTTGNWQLATGPRPLILLADDNADMRDYVKRVLSAHWDVEAVADGRAALARCREQIPDLVISDVMMPGLDGFELLRELRSDPLTQGVPVILLSARAGEESRIEGLDAGADDYMAKPFSARELIAHVGAHLKIARIRGEAEERLRESESRLRYLFDKAPTFVALMRGPEHVFDLANAAYLQLVGRRELIGRNVRDALSELEGQGFFELLDAVYATGEPFVGREMRVSLQRTPGGPMEERFLDFVHQAVFEADGKVSGIFAHGVDVTEQVRARKAIEEANRMKDEFLATLSHELRNPLNSILGYAQVLQRSIEAEQSTLIRQASTTIYKNAQAQAQLINDLLDLSRLQTGKLAVEPQPLELAPLIGEAVETVRAQAVQKGIHLNVGLLAEPLTVNADPVRLQQIVWNLVNNAVKFTPKGGQVSVFLDRERDAARLIVEDSGQGIAAEFLPHVFEMFRQADAGVTRRHGGLGVGLALVRQLTELHSGKVEVHSDGPGRGAQFTVRLPLHRATLERSGGAASLQVTGELSGARILIVDDTQDSLEMLHFLLSGEGASVKTASSGAAGLAIASETDLDLVISDISMPGMDGYEFLQALRTNPRHVMVPAIALTGFGRDEDVMRARQAGFTTHLTKPLDFDTLLQLARGTIEK